MATPVIDPVSLPPTATICSGPVHHHEPPRRRSTSSSPPHPRSRRRPGLRPHHGHQHGAAAPVHPRCAPPGARNRWRNRRRPAPPTSAICTPASRKPARPSSTSRSSPSPTASTISRPMSNNLCYCLAVEKLLGLEIPERAQYLRVLLNELTRISSHLVWLGTHAMDIGALTMFLYCWREREDVSRIYENVSGQRMMSSYFRIGGLSLEPPLDFYQQVQRLPHPHARPHRPVRRPAHRQPHLDGPPQGRRPPLRRRRHRPRRHRPAPPRLRRRLGPSPRHALLRLREVQVQGPRLRPRRRLGPLHRSHGGDARVRQNLPGRRSTACPPAASPPTPPRSSCPTAKR